MTIEFSEKLKSYLDFMNTFSRRNLAEEFLEVIYINNNNGLCIPTTPSLDDW